MFFYSTVYKADFINKFKEIDLNITRLREKLSNQVEQDYGKYGQLQPERQEASEMDDGITDEAKRFIMVNDLRK